MSDKVKATNNKSISFDFKKLNDNVNVISIMMGDTPTCPNCGTSKSKHCGYWGNNAFKCFKCGYSTHPYKIALEMNDDDKYKAILNLDTIITENNLNLKAKKAFRVKPIASPEMLNEAYGYLINNSKLTRKDLNYLRSRGLSKEEIENRQFRSASSIKEAFAKIKDKEAYHNVPGVYFETDTKTWQFNIFQGIIIPIANNGFIKGLQVRTENPEMRYIWISSSQKNGTGPGAPFDERHTAKTNKRAIITEGVFKSMAIEKLDAYEYIFSVQGIGNTKKVIKYINKLHAEGKLESIDLAFDMDVTLDTKHQGNKLIKDFANQLTFNIKADTLIWDEQYKGIDDLPHKDGLIDTSYIKRKK